MVHYMILLPRSIFFDSVENVCFQRHIHVSLVGWPCRLLVWDGCYAGGLGIIIGQDWAVTMKKYVQIFRAHCIYVSEKETSHLQVFLKRKKNT